MLNSKLVSKPCKEICFCYKLDPKHDQNFKEHNFKRCRIHTRIHILRIPARISYTCVHTVFLTNKHRKNTHLTITQFLCLILNMYIKDWLTHKNNHLKNNNIQIREFPACLKNFRIRRPCQCTYTLHNLITLLRQFVSMYSASSSFDKENTTKIV